MANIFDYLDWRGDLTLSERAFNEVDNLILAEICYLDLSGFAPAGFETQQVTLREAWDAYFAAHPTTDMGVLVPDQIPVLVQKAAQTARFGSLRLLGYVNRIDEETQTQFSAMTMLLPDGSAYVAFRGTDDTIVGWKEDFNMAFTPEIPAQRYAADYLQQAAAALAFRPLLVGGHSKGGNLAMYAAAMVPESVQERIGNIYNNDGPGFQEKILQTEGYRRIKPRIKTILSQNAMVGTLLWNDCDYTVVKSTAALLGAHDGFTWETTPTSFVRCENLSPSARAFDRAMEEVLVGMSMAERQEFIEEFFGTLTATGAVTLSDLSARMLRETLRFARAVHQEPSLHKMVNETLEAMAKGYAAERNWSLSRLKLPANPLRRKKTKEEQDKT